MTLRAENDLDERNVLDYLVERRLLDPGASAQVDVLSGGVSSQVIKVVSGDRRYIVKQSLPALRVAAVWRADPRRILNEAAALRHVAKLLPPGAVPAIRDVDSERFVLVMSCAAEGAVNWKRELLDGHVDPRVVATVADYLGLLHERGEGDPHLQAEFADVGHFRELRIDPYFRTAAAVHPDVAPQLLAIAHRSLTNRRALVHGDYSPKNVLVAPGESFTRSQAEGAKDKSGREVLLLDFEVAHYGDPSFDVGFMLNHLLLKGLYHLDFPADFFSAARLFWRRYQDVRWPVAPDLERQCVEQLGGLMLARIDGKSPAEYVRDLALRALVRQVSKRILVERPPSVEAALQLVEGSLPVPDRSERTMVPRSACADENPPVEGRGARIPRSPPPTTRPPARSE